MLLCNIYKQANNQLVWLFFTCLQGSINLILYAWVSETHCGSIMVKRWKPGGSTKTYKNFQDRQYKK